MKNAWPSSVIVASTSTGLICRVPGRGRPRPYSNLEPSLLLRDAHGLQPVARVELLDRRGEVVADGPLGEKQALGHLGDAGSVGRGDEHLGLPLRERAVALRQ